MTFRSRPRLTLHLGALLAAGFLLFLVRVLAGQTPTPSPLTLLTREGRRAIPLALVNDQEFIAVDDLVSIFQLSVHEESGALTISYKGKTIVVTPDQALASVSGKLISLPAPPAHSGRRWLLPVEFISRAVAPVYDSRVDLRKPSHLLVVGDLRVPRVAVRYELQSTGAARLIIDAVPKTTSTVSQENDRLSIRFDADALDAALPQIQALGLVQGVRLVEPVTLAVDLGPRFGSFRASTPPMDASARVVIDIVSTTTEAAPAPPAPPTPPPPAPDLTGLSPAAALRAIAVDAGHGGEDAGATGPAGVKEKDLTLAIARRLKAAIEARLGVRVLLTRDEDRNTPVDDRTAVANNNKADLFLSLHASASLRPGTTGAAIFVAAFDDKAVAMARPQAEPERLPTYSGAMRDIEMVLWDLAQTRHVDQSTDFAKMLEQSLRGRVPLAAHAVDRAPLRVLESANMPAILVDIGYLTNPVQEKQLAGGEFQTTLVQAIVDAVVRFRDRLANPT